MTDTTPDEHHKRTPLKVFAAVVLAVTIGAGVLAISLYASLQRTANAPHENIQWATYQLQAEHLKLMLAAEDAQLGHVDLEELRERYEIFVSRILVLRDGSVYEIMHQIPGYTDTLNRTLDIVARVDAASAGNAVDTLAFAAIVRDYLSELADPLQNIALASVSTASRDQSERQIRILDTVSHLAIALGLIVAASFGLAAVTMKQLAALQAGRRELATALWRAEASNRAKSRFLAGMSHEMRTPLNAVIGLLREIGYRTSDIGIQRLAGTAHASADMLCGLVDDVLDTTRIETGKLRLHFTTFDPQGLVEEVTSVLLSRAEDRTNRLVVDTDDIQVRYVISDRGRLKQVLVNLVGNAIKYTRDGTITVRASVAQGPGSSAMLRISVTDTGIGVAPHLHDKIFGRFYQAGNNDGLGLGLSISREIVEHLGGRIGVSSALRQGSTFWFEVPVSVAARPTRPSEASGRHDRLAGVRLLVAEDNSTNRQVVRLLLERHRADFDFATNGQEAVDRALTSTYDAVLMDINMPVMDGLQAVAEIVRRAGPKAPPVIALTADALPEDHERFRAAGMVACVTKPIDEEELLRTLAQVLGRPAFWPDASYVPAPATTGPNASEPLSDRQRAAVMGLLATLGDGEPDE